MMPTTFLLIIPIRLFHPLHHIDIIPRLFYPYLRFIECRHTTTTLITIERAVPILPNMNLFNHIQSLTYDNNNAMINGTSTSTFFEMIAQLQLIPTLRHAFIYALHVAATRFWHRTYIAHILNTYADEVFLILQYLLDRHYIRYYDASFAEHFYGLKRMHTPYDHNLIDTDMRLPTSTKRWSLFFLVLIPYLGQKLDKMYRTQYRKRQKRCRVLSLPVCTIMQPTKGKRMNLYLSDSYNAYLRGRISKVQDDMAHHRVHL